MKTTIVLKEQAAVNYASALTSAANDVKVFRAKELASRSKK